MERVIAELVLFAEVVLFTIGMVTSTEQSNTQMLLNCSGVFFLLLLRLYFVSCRNLCTEAKKCVLVQI